MTSSQLAIDGSYMTETDGEVSNWNSSFGKRLLDIIGSSMVLALASPLVLLVAAAVKTSSAGPILFRQQRVGKAGAEFELLKFRTMYHHPPGGGPGITRKGDNRVTPLGKLLRQWKIDELPQLLNVLRGQMSLIGPRPDLPEFYSTLNPARRQILRLKPGITGWATLHFRDEESVLAALPHEEIVNFYVSDLLPRKVDLDLSYARGATLKSDIGILVQTFVAILLTGAKRSSGDR